ncbi:hypothetical protein CN918_32000 [Priestia megaterium]|nr:hypothetical protein CN918_32000 [Priestia megaterium]
MYENYESADFQSSSSTSAHLKKVYAWMFLAILVTAVVSVFIAENDSLFNSIFTSKTIIVLLVVEVLFAFILGPVIVKLPPAVGFIMFMIYSILNGITLSVIFEVYTTASIANTFFIAAGMFAAISIYGYTTKRDMSGLGTFFFMALIGFLIASVINIFVGSSTFEWILSVIGVLLFSGLTAYDTQMIKNEPFYRKYPLMGALQLYLDFINLFINLLKLFGDD